MRPSGGGLPARSDERSCQRPAPAVCEVAGLSELLRLTSHWSLDERDFAASNG